MMAFSQDEINRMIATGQLTPETGAALSGQGGALVGPSPADYANPPQEVMTKASPVIGPSNTITNPYAAQRNLNPVSSRTDPAAPQMAVAPPDIQPAPPPAQYPQQGQRPGPDAVDPSMLAMQQRRQQQMPPASGGPAGAGGPTGYGEMQSALGRYNKATQGNLNEQGRNIEAQAEADRRAIDERAREMQRQNDQQAATDQWVQAEHEERSAKAGDALKELNAQSAELGNYKEDPNGLWHNMSSGQQMLATLGLAMSAVGNKQGEAMGLINKAMDRDIDAQRANYSAKKDSLAAKNSAFGRLMDHYKDQDSAALALRTMQLDQAARKLQLMTVSSQSEQVQLKAAQALTALNQERAKTALQFQQQQYSIAHPAGAGGSDIPRALTDVYGKDRAAIKQALLQHIQEHPEDKHPYESLVANAVNIAKKGEAGGDGGGQDIKLPRQLQGVLAKDIAVENTGDTVAEQYGLKTDPKTGEVAPSSALSGAWNYGKAALVDPILNPGLNANRKATRETMVDERASIAAQGQPGEQTMAQYRHQQDTSNPWVQAAIINEAKRAGKSQKAAILKVAKHSIVQSERESDDDK